MIGLILGVWIIISSLIAIFSSYKLNLSLKFVQIINPHIAHIGVGIAIIGITCSSVFKQEYDYNINEGTEFKIDDTLVLFEKIETTNKDNFQALRAKFQITLDKNNISTIRAGKNYYPVSKMIFPS